MDKQTVDLFMMTHSKHFRPEDINFIREEIEKLDESQVNHLHSLNLKDPTTTLIISVVGGTLGIDRFFLGDVGIGIAKLLTCGGFYIGAIVDWFLIQGRARDLNRERVVAVTNMLAIGGTTATAELPEDSSQSDDQNSGDSNWSDDVNKSIE